MTIIEDKQDRLVNTLGLTVQFSTPFSTPNYWIKVRCFDSSGNVGYTITDQTVNGFTITPMVQATVEYEAIQYSVIPG